MKVTSNGLVFDNHYIQLFVPAIHQNRGMGVLMQVHTDIEVIFSSLHIILLLSCHPHKARVPATSDDSLRPQNGQGRDSLSTARLTVSNRLLWCVMLTLSETDCKSFLRLYQNCQLQKRKSGGTGISFTPLSPL